MEATNMTKILEAVNNLVHFTIECTNGHPYENEKRKAIEDLINIAGRHTWIPCSQAMPEHDKNVCMLYDHVHAKGVDKVVAFGYYNASEEGWHIDCHSHYDVLCDLTPVVAWREQETNEELMGIG